MGFAATRACVLAGWVLGAVCAAEVTGARCGVHGGSAGRLGAMGDGIENGEESASGAPAARLMSTATTAQPTTAAAAAHVDAMRPKPM